MDGEIGCMTEISLIGMVLAVIISWSCNHSILWAVVHGMLGWLYVGYGLVAN